MAGITRPIITEIAKDTFLINEFGLVTEYVIVGDERALVLDTGCSLQDLPATIAALTDKPYDVMITHAHLDHVAGNAQFESVYVHEDDAEDCHPGPKEEIAWFYDIFAKRWPPSDPYLQHLDMAENYPFRRYQLLSVFSFDMGNYVEGKHDTKIFPVKDGHVFHLGNRDVEVIHTPGHTKGACMFLDRREKILFSGDSMQLDLINNGARPLSTCLRALVRVRGLYGKEYSRIYSSHMSFAGTIDLLSVPVRILDDLIEAYRAVLRNDGSANIVVDKATYNPEQKTYRSLYGCVTPTYDPERLWEPGEEHIVP